MRKRSAQHPLSRSLLAAMTASLLLLAACAPGAPTDAGTSPQNNSNPDAKTDTNADKNSENKPSDNSGEAVDYFAKFDPPITLTSMMFDDNLRNVPEGMNKKDNPWVNLYKEHGINVEYKISGSADELNTKLNMAIASQDLPDIIQATAQQFADLVEADYLYDLTEAYDRYLSPETKALFLQDGGLMAENGVVGGKHFGIVQPAGYQDFVPVAAIRADWLREAGLQPPETLSDLWNIAKTFQEKKMGGTCTIGVGLTSNVTTMLTPTIGLLNAYHAYSGLWIEKDGALVNSSIQPEMKAALEKLNGYYQQGLIDPEFGSKDTAKLMEDALSGRSGVVVSHFCAPFDLMNGVKTGQEWAYYRMPSDDGKPVKAQESVGFGGATCFNKKSEHPEAMMVMYNLYTKYVKEDPQHYSADAILNFAYPTQASIIDANNKIHREYLEFLETGKKPASVTEGYDVTVEAAEKYRLDKNIDGYTMWGVFGPEGTQRCVTYAIENDGYLVNRFTGAPTESMVRFGANLQTMEEQMITYIIKGTKPASYFDEFVASWKANGGDAITKEVNDWYTSK